MDGRQKAARDFGAAFADAIAVRSATLVWLRDRLADRGSPVSLTTLSYWRSGRSRPEGAASLAAVAELEALLGLDAGDLMRHVGPNRRVGRVGAPVFPASDPDLSRECEEIIGALGAARQDSFRDLVSQYVVEVDEHGRQHSRTLRSIVQATRGTLRELPYVELCRLPSADPPEFEAVAGCTVGRRLDHRSRRVFGVAVTLDEPVVAPSTTIVEFTTHLPAGFPLQDEVTYGVGRRNHGLAIWVRFHPDRPPTAWEEFMIPTGDGDRAEIVLASGGRTRSLHTYRSRFGPGELGLRWSL